MRAGGEKVAYMIGFENIDAHLFLGETTHLWMRRLEASAALII